MKFVAVIFRLGLVSPRFFTVWRTFSGPRLRVFRLTPKLRFLISQLLLGCRRRRLIFIIRIRNWGKIPRLRLAVHTGPRVGTVLRRWTSVGLRRPVLVKPVLLLRMVPFLNCLRTVVLLILGLKFLLIPKIFQGLTRPRFLMSVFFIFAVVRLRRF